MVLELGYEGLRVMISKPKDDDEGTPTATAGSSLCC
jgi:hypothetical protein